VIKAMPGQNLLALPEARLVERSILCGLAPLDIAARPSPAREAASSELPQPRRRPAVASRLCHRFRGLFSPAVSKPIGSRKTSD
jgi:hypothetical protein